MRAGQPSETARRVAGYRLGFARVPVEYGDPNADELLARDVAGPTAGVVTAMRDYLEARTRFFDWVVVDAIAVGIDQVVVGAAGYDGRAWRYAKAGVVWFEIDHPATQADKLARLGRLGIGADHVRFVAADFECDELGPALCGSGLDTTRASLFLLEGVAVYLRRPTLESVLGQFGSVAGRGSRLAISLSPGGRSATRSLRWLAFRAAVAALGEPARTDIPPKKVEAFLAGVGWKLPQSFGEGASWARAAGLVLAEPSQ